MKKIKTIVSPSLLSADFYNLEKEITLIKEGGATWLHYDVMDGHFVPNLTIGVPVVKTLTKKTGLFNDVHIMIEDPYTYGPIFASAGADLVTFHYEALKSNEEVIKTIEVIKKAGAKVGIS